MIQDQAQRLRELSKFLSSPQQSSRVLTIASGKGGVGKSNFTLNFALCLIELGKKVVVIDLDIGMANLDVLMGLSPKYHLIDMIQQRKSIWDVLEKGPKGLEYVAGGSGFDEISQLSESEMDYFLHQLEQLHGYADIILIDTGAGLTAESQQCHLAADEIILLTTPEPTAITDAYAIVKILHGKNPLLSFQLVVNRVSHPQEGIEVASKLKMAAQQFLNKEIKVFGAISDDTIVMQSVLKQVPFYLAYPHSLASTSIKRLAERFVSGDSSIQDEGSGMKGFVRKLSQFFKGKKSI